MEGDGKPRRAGKSGAVRCGRATLQASFASSLRGNGGSLKLPRLNYDSHQKTDRTNTDGSSFA
jgi:hypothetical protein